MSQVKISQLPVFNTINANTANTLFVGVDVPTDVTFQMTAHTLAQGLYSNENLNVGSNPNTLPNTVAQFVQGGNSYIQTNLVNTNDGGSADIVVTANAGSGGTDSAYFIDMGFVNKNYQPGSEFNNIGTAVSPLDGYLYVQGGAIGAPGGPGGNLIVGTTTANTELRFIVGGGTSSNVVAKMNSKGLVLTGNVTPSGTNVYSLGTSTLRWGDIWIGPNTINITDTVTGNNAGLTVANGILQIQGANQLQVGQLKFINNTIESITGNVDIQIDLTSSSANLVINRNVVTAAGKTIGLIDATTNVAATLSSNNGTIVIAGATGILVGNIKIFGSTIESSALSTDIQLGDPAASANLVINRNTIFTKNITSNNITTNGLEFIQPNYINITAPSSNVQLSNTVSHNILITNNSSNPTIIMPANPKEGQICSFTNAGPNTVALYSSSSNPTIIPSFVGSPPAKGYMLKYVWNSANTQWIVCP